MKPLLLAAALAGVAGCATVVDPLPREPYETKADWHGSVFSIEADPGKAVISLSPGAFPYEFEAATWNPFLADALRDDVHRLGAGRSDAPVLTVSLFDVRLEPRTLGQGFHAEIVLAANPAGTVRLYTGAADTLSNYPDAARRATADAIKRLVEDDDLRRLMSR